MWEFASSLPVLLLSLLLSRSYCEVVHYYTNEEEPPGTVIAVLSQHPKFSSSDGSFRLMKQFNSSLVHVRTSDGQLSIGERLDREQICKQSLNCILALDVVSFSKEQFSLIHVKVEVRDINDNSPYFPNPEIPVEVSESSPVGTRIPLPVAIDEDVGSNSIQDFELSDNSHFSIDVQTRADGVKYAELVLMKELDRERQSSYTLELVAMDGGSPSRSGSAVIHVKVMDFNDNSPVFERNTVVVELIEDAPPGHHLLDLKAADSDEGVNAEIVYGFSPQVPQEVRQLFKLDPKSGRLTLEGQVDFELKQTYEFDVQAHDSGANPLTATCKIIVHIIDVNDNAPDISITPLTSISSGVAYITEAAAKGSLVALISTTDRDSGPNGQVHCTLYGHDHFKLQPAYEDSFMIVTTSSLDREKIAEYNLTVVAEDKGYPSLKTNYHYTIRVSDENDNPPMFSKPAFEVSILENNAPGAYITTVVARDPDTGNNGKVSYSLVEEKVFGQSLSTFVAIDADSGVLRAVRSLDYEKLKQIDVQVEATDNGTPQLSSRTQLQIKIVDQNDNAPVITYPILDSSSADIMLPVNAPPNYLVFQIKATDADEGLNSQLFYTILRDTNRLFSINKGTGEVSLRRKITPTQVEDLSIVIAVYDSGRPSLFSNATIKFILTDSTPSSVEIVIMHSSEEEQQQFDLSIIFIAVLSGGCALLLIAIIFVACTCKRKSSQFKRDSEVSRIYREDQPLSSSGPSSSNSSSSDAQSESCQLSINTESEDCRFSTHSDQNGDLNRPSDVSASDHSIPTSSWHQENPTRMSSLTSQEEQCSTKDSGRGDSDFNDSDSDTSGECPKKNHTQSIQNQPGVMHIEHSRALPKGERCFSYGTERGLYNGNFMLHHEMERAMPLPLATTHYNTYNPRIQNVHILHQHKESYYHYNNATVGRLQRQYEVDMVNRGATMSPPRLSRKYQEYSYNPETLLHNHASEIATTF
ncbi:protocadherin-8-like [Spea bombifrons]|uniref:protocadherin-8-like n=1 Tax=Spea bombifrons TaxID=233779 RepID=UPI00234A79C7|nr:protocadherin-8-like [Spea bombifrons]